MNTVMFLFGSGFAFFLGVGFILVALTVCSCARSRIAATLLALFGLILVLLSAAPLPYWLYAVAGGSTVGWLIVERLDNSRWRRIRRLMRIAVVGHWIAAAAMELPYQFMGPVSQSRIGMVSIIGDSVAAGFGTKQEETWPKLLSRSARIDVKDFSRVGATAASAAKQAEGLPPGGGVVLVEIGGNDLLGSTSAPDFERDLSQLLDRVCQPGRAVIMFELPLPPFRNEYGRIQRRLASKHGIVLIPKRILIGVLTEEGMTTDGIHLSRAGHERMAAVIGNILQEAFHDR